MRSRASSEFQFLVRRAAAIGLLVMAPAMVLAVTTCFCNSFGSACNSFEPDLEGTGYDCWAPAVGSDMIWQAQGYVGLGWKGVNAGAFGKCKYKLGHSQPFGGGCAYGISIYEVNIQSSTVNTGSEACLECPQ